MTATETPVLAAPFRGLAPFRDTELDALLFFGRERETEIAVANLLASRLTILYGPTGVGKSSLLQAGVARRVHELGGRRAIGRGPDSAAIVFSAWADEPVAALAEAIADEVTGLIEREVPRPPPGTSLADVVEHWAAVLDGDLYLVLDQLEEYFVYSENGGPRSFELDFPEIVLRPRLRANVLLSLRDDALAQLDVFKGSLPNLFANYLRLDRLDRAAATAAIKGPIQRWNEMAPEEARVEIEPQLVEDVLAQAAATGEPDRVEPPYLQLVLERLWNAERERGSRTLRAATLAELGGAGAIVREHLDRALSVLDDRERDAAALMFDHLVTPSGTKVAHRTADLAQFARVPEPEAETVLGALGRERILRSLDEGTGSGVRFEIFHDVLAGAILGWRRGRDLEHERLAARRHRRNLVAVALASLLAVVVMAAITVFALSQRSSARSQTRSANARALAASALTQLDTDPELSLLLARRAASLSGSTLVEGVLRSSLLDSRVRHVVQLGGPGVAAVFQRGTGRAVGVTADGRVVVARAATGEVVERASIPARRALLDPVGHRVLGYGRHMVPRLLDIASRSTLALGTRGVVSAVFSPDGRLLATTNLRHRLQIWSSPTGRLVQALEVSSLHPAVAFSPNGELFAVADARTVTVRDLGTGRVTATIPEPSIVAHVAFGPNSRLLAVAGLDKIVRLHNAATGARLATYAGQVGQVTGVAFSPSTALLATTSTDGTARVWRTDGRGSFVSPLIGHQNYVTSAAFSPDGYRVVTASKDGTARVWQAVSGDPVAVLAGNADSVTSASFSDDGRTVVTSSADGAMRFWSAVAQPELALRAQKPWPIAAARVARGGIVIAPRGGRDVSVSADGARYATVDAGRVVVRSAPGGATLGSFPAPAPITGVAIAPDGTTVAVGGADGTARIYNLRGELVRTLRADRATLTHLAFSPDGSLLAAGSTDDTAKLWNLSTGAVRVLAAHEAPVLSARFNSAGTEVVTASMDHDARLWDVATGRMLGKLRGHFGKVSDAGFSPDGRWVVTAGPGKAGLWDARSGALLFFLQGHDGALTSASFAPDGRTIVTSGVDHTVRSYVCDVCAGVPGLVRLANGRLAQTHRRLTPAELRALVP